MGRILIVAAVLAVALLALDFSGVISVFPGKPTLDEDDTDSSLLESDSDGEAAALRGTGRDRPLDPVETPADEPEVLSEVRGTRSDGGSIRGRIVRGDPALPVAGAKVLLDRPHALMGYLRAPVNGRFDQLEASSDEEGHFAFVELAPSDKYVVRAQHGETPVASSDAIDLRGGGHRELGDIELGAKGGLKGRILSQDGSPVAGAEVTVTWFSRNALQIVLTEPDLLPRIEAQVSTGEDGRFEMDSLGPGTKTAIVTTPFGASDGKYRVEINAGESNDLGDWKLGSKHFIAGKVVWGDGKPVEGARVIAGPIGNPISRQTMTDASGAFRLANLPPAKGYGIGTLVQGLPVALKFNVELDKDDVEIRLALPSVLRGRVVSAETKEPVPRFSIVLKRSKPTGDYISDMVAKTVTTALGARPFEDDGGEFAFEPMASGEFDLVVTAAGHAAFTKQVTVVSGVPLDIVVELPEGKSASGVVVDALDNGVEAQLFVFPEGEPASEMGTQQRASVLSRRMPDGVANAQGVFVLKPQTPGSYEIVAIAEGHLPAFLGPLELGERNVTDLTLRLPASATIKGRVQGPQGQGPRDEINIVVFFDDFTSESVKADKDGSFEFKMVPIGRAIVKWAFDVDYNTYNEMGAKGDVAQAAYDKLKLDNEEITLQRGQVTRVTVVLPRRTTVNGVVRPHVDNKDRIRGVYWLKLPEKTRFTFCRCDDKGRFTYALIPGAYEAYVPTVSGRWLPQKIDIPDASETELELDQPADLPR